MTNYHNYANSRQRLGIILIKVYHVHILTYYFAKQSVGITFPSWGVRK